MTPSNHDLCAWLREVEKIGELQRIQNIPDSREDMSTLCSQSDGIHWSGPLDPVIPRERKGFNSRALIDATRPYEWKDQFPAVNAVSDDFKAGLDLKYASLIYEVLGRVK